MVAPNRSIARTVKLFRPVASTMPVSVHCCWLVHVSTHSGCPSTMIEKTEEGAVPVRETVAAAVVPPPLVVMAKGAV